MHIGTERQEFGRARQRKYVVTEEVQQTVPVCHEEVRVEREPVTESNCEATAGPDISEAEHEVTLHAERPVVETKAGPVERVRLTTDERTDEETVTGEVRKDTGTGQHSLLELTVFLPQGQRFLRDICCRGVTHWKGPAWGLPISRSHALTPARATARYPAPPVNGRYNATAPQRSGFKTAAVLLVPLTGVAWLHIRLLLGRVTARDSTLTVHLRVEFQAQEDRQVCDPQPHQEDDHSGEGSVGLVVRARACSAVEIPCRDHSLRRRRMVRSEHPGAGVGSGTLYRHFPVTPQGRATLCTHKRDRRRAARAG
jgi:hypothetical protein